MSKKIKFVDTSNLPRKNNNEIDWEKSVGCRCSFIYGEINDEVEIIDYKKDLKNIKINVRYKNNKNYISVGNFKQGNIGRILMKHTPEFKYEINQEFISKKTGNKFKILNREKRIRKDKYGEHKEKWYLYKCLKCGYEHWMIEMAFSRISSCPCCLGRVVVQGINDIPTTDPWMIDYFQGGYDEAKLYTHGSNSIIDMKCPMCNTIKPKIQICKLYANHSIGCKCDTSMSFPEQVLYNLLEQFNIPFIHQLTKKHYKWIKNYRYDFYIETNDEKTIIECHGDQHYNKPIYNKKTIEYEKNNDLTKKQLALNNGIDNYYEVDCSKSDVSYIIQSLKNVGILDKYNIDPDIINVDQLYTKILSKDIKKCTEILNQYPYISAKELSHMSKIPVYRVKKVLRLLNIELSITAKNKIDMYKDGEYIYTFSSMSDVKRKSLEKVGVVVHVRDLKKYIEENKVFKKHYTFKYHTEKEKVLC